MLLRDSLGGRKSLNPGILNLTFQFNVFRSPGSCHSLAQRLIFIGLERSNGLSVLAPVFHICLLLDTLASAERGYLWSCLLLLGVRVKSYPW